MDVRLRSARPSDHGWIIESVDQWWGRPVASALPRLFLDHFANTSLVAEVDQGNIGFLIGFLSPSQLSVAYIHFVGVHPAYRRTGVATELYDQFFRIAGDDGRDVISAITTPANVDSIRFHQRLGFETTPELPDYNRPGAPAVAFHRQRPVDTKLRPVVIAVCGSPGAGKTTVARAVGEHLGVPVLHRDEFKTSLGLTAATANPEGELAPPPDYFIAGGPYSRLAERAMLRTSRLLASSGATHVIESSVITEDAVSELRRSGARVLAVHVVASTDAISERLRDRMATDDPVAEQLARQHQHGEMDPATFEPPASVDRKIQVDTSRGDHPEIGSLISAVKDLLR